MCEGGVFCHTGYEALKF